MARRGSQPDRPVGPGQPLVGVFGRLGHDLELGDALGALPVGGADAVAAGIAAADHDHVLVRGGQRATWRGTQLVVAGIALVLLGQEFHRQPHAGQFGAGNFELARFLGPAGEHDRVEILLQGGKGDIDPDLGAGAELDAFALHLHRAAIDQVLFHLEVGNAVAQQPADPVGLLEHRHRMACARELLGAGEPGRAAADHRDRLAGVARRDLRPDPALVPAAVDDRALDALDGHRLVDDVERAGLLARRWADAAGKLGKIVGRMEHVERAPPVVLVDEVVPVGDDVVHRAAGVTIGDAAIHAARRLIAQLVRRGRDHELLVIAQPFGRIEIITIAPLDFEKAGFLAHSCYAQTCLIIPPPPSRPRGVLPRAPAARGDSRAA